MSLVESVIRKLKKDPGYKINSTYTSKQFRYILYARIMQLVRGLWIKWKISSNGFVFSGRNVIIEHAYQVKAGKSLIIEDGVHINALSSDGIKIGDNVTIGKSAILVCTGVIANKGTGIKIGNNSAIGAQSFLGGQGGIEIGNDVIMGPQVKVFSENHNFELDQIVIRKQGEKRVGVIINDNCWIGAGCTILDGVEIGEGCVIAAGSVITKSMPANSVIAGVPAKIIKSRIANKNV